MLLDSSVRAISFENHLSNWIFIEWKIRDSIKMECIQIQVKWKAFCTIRVMGYFLQKSHLLKKKVCNNINSQFWKVSFHNFKIKIVLFNIILLRYHKRIITFSLFKLYYNDKFLLPVRFTFVNFVIFYDKSKKKKKPLL